MSDTSEKFKCAMPDAVPPRPRCAEQCRFCAVQAGNAAPNPIGTMCAGRIDQAERGDDGGWAAA